MNRARTPSLRRLALPSLIPLLLAACSGGAVVGPSASAPVSATAAVPSATAEPTATPSPTAGTVELTVLAASSLSDAFRDLAAAYEKAHPNVLIALSFDATSALRSKVEAGLVADVFAAADDTSPVKLLAAGLARGEPVTFASNTLALVVPLDNPAKINDPYDLERPGVRVIAAVKEAPISKYVDTLIGHLQAFRGAQAEFPRIYEANIVSREDNVRAVLAKIELGEGDAGFVYATDAAASAKVTSIPIPPETQVVAPDAAIALSAGTHPAEADAFVAWLSSDQAQGILLARGFRPAP